MIRIALALTLAAALLSACGDEADTATSAAAPVAEPAALPVTIEHRYGSTTIEDAPERVVVAGLREQDALLALGIVPVATTEWYGDHPGAIFPWAKESGRTIRICSNLLLQEAGYPVAVVHSIDRQRYYESLRGEASGLLSLYLEAVQTTAETELRLYEEAEKSPKKRKRA